MYSDEIGAPEMYPPPSAGWEQLKRKEWLATRNGNKVKFKRSEVGETSTAKRSKHQNQETAEEIREQNKKVEFEEKGNMLRGVVGPEPQLAP